MQLEWAHTIASLTEQCAHPSANYPIIPARFLEKLHAKLLALDKASRAYSAMQRELEHFLLHYYARILPLCERLESLRHGVDLSISTARHSIHPKIQVISKNDALRVHLKSHYRALMKAHHPDIATTHIKTRAIRDIVAAYEEHRLGTLWMYRIEHECTVSDPLHIAPCLKKHYRTIDFLLREVQACAKELMSSAAWELKERTMEADLRGVDLIQTTARRIEAHIAALHKKESQRPKILSYA